MQAAKSLQQAEAEKFGKQAGIRNARSGRRRGSCSAATSTAWLPGCRTTIARIADMDEQGVAADVIFHGGLNGHDRSRFRRPA